VYREEANRQREGKPKGSREKVAHARTGTHEEESLQPPATERTVKVHQSGQQSFILLRLQFAAFPGSMMAICREFSFTTQQPTGRPGPSSIHRRGQWATRLNRDFSKTGVRL
jgi:hypothetical protein